jgi:hypothetical protein
MLTRSFLQEIKKKALRRKIWYSAIDGVERGIMSLAIRMVEKVESAVLGVVLVKILKKIREGLKSKFSRRMDEFGLKRAREISRLALAWGNITANIWISDLGFVKYLTLIDMNKSLGFGV